MKNLSSKIHNQNNNRLNLSSKIHNQNNNRINLSSKTHNQNNNDDRDKQQERRQKEKCLPIPFL